MTLTKSLWAAGATLLLAGCDYDLPSSLSRGRRGSGGGGGGAVVVRVEPDAPLDAVPRAVRFHVSAGSLLDPEAIALVRGRVGPGQLRDIGRRDPSETLRERFVPSIAWRDGDTVVLAPQTLLDPKEAYTLAVGEAAESFDVRAAPMDARPVLARVWPPPEIAPGEAFAVWCGDAPLPLVDAPVSLDPGGQRGYLRRGAVEGGAGARCVRFDVTPGAAKPGSPGIPPPLVTSLDGSVALALDPSPILSGGGVSPMPSIPCDPDEAAFGPGCARFADDRLFARSPGAALLWAIGGPGVDAVIAVGAGDPFTVAGLLPSTELTLDVAAVDPRGTRVRMLTSAVTEPPMPHVILNEALANPLGPEPVSEWVEIVNDGQAPADLDGYSLTDGGGKTALPKATLAPGGYALIVNEGYVEDNGLDPRPPQGALILRVPHLGKNGLANAGEPLALSDAQGNIVSRFPALPKPKAGMSVARRAPISPDAPSSSWAVAAPTPGVANGL